MFINQFIRTVREKVDQTILEGDEVSIYSDLLAKRSSQFDDYFITRVAEYEAITLVSRTRHEFIPSFIDQHVTTGYKTETIRLLDQSEYKNSRLQYELAFRKTPFENVINPKEGTYTYENGKIDWAEGEYTHQYIKLPRPVLFTTGTYVSGGTSSTYSTVLDTVVSYALIMDGSNVVKMLPVISHFKVGATHTVNFAYSYTGSFTEARMILSPITQLRENLVGILSDMVASTLLSSLKMYEDAKKLRELAMVRLRDYGLPRY